MKHVWNGWIGKEIVRCESDDDALVIVLEDGRGLKIWGPHVSFNVRDLNGEIWPAVLDIRPHQG